MNVHFVLASVWECWVKRAGAREAKNCLLKMDFKCYFVKHVSMNFDIGKQVVFLQNLH